MICSTPDNYLDCGLKRVIHQLHNENLEHGVSTNKIGYFHDILGTISSLDGEFKKLERFLLFCKYNSMQPCHKNHAIKYSTCDVDSLNDIADVFLSLLRNMKTETILQSKIIHGEVYPKTTHPVNTLLGLKNKLFGLLEIIENVKTNIIRQYPHLGLSGIHYNSGVGMTPLHHRNISYKNNKIKCNKFGSNAFLMNRILFQNNVWEENFNLKSCKQRNKHLKHTKSSSGDEINKIKPIKYNRYEAKKSIQLFGNDKPKRLTRERKKMAKSHDLSNFFSNVINQSVHKHTSESFHKLLPERVHHARNKTIKANDVNNTTNNITHVYKTRKRAGKDSSSRTRYLYADHLYMARVRRGDDDRNQVRRSNRNNNNKQQISKPPLSEYAHTTGKSTPEALEGTRGSFERRAYNSKRIQNSDNENSKNNFERFIYYFPIEDRATIEDYIPNHTRKFRNKPSNKFHYTARKSIEAVPCNYSVIAGKSYEKASISNKRKKKYKIARVCSPRKYIDQECEPGLFRSSYNHGHLKNKTPYSLLKQKYHFEKWQCRPKCIESRCGNKVQQYFEKIPSKYTKNREDNYFDHHGFNCYSPSQKDGCARFKENTCFNIGQGRHIYPHIYDGTMLFPHSNGYSQCNKSLADMSSKYRLTSKNKQEFIVVKQHPSRKRPQPCVIRHYGCKDCGEAYLDVGRKFVKNRPIARNIQKLSTFQPVVIDHETSSSTYSSSENESQDEERNAYRYTNSIKRRLRKSSILSTNNQSYDLVYYKEAPHIQQKSYHRKYRKSIEKSRELLYSYMLSSSEESIYERPDMKAKRTSTSELITNMKTIAINTHIANGPDLFSRRTSTSGLVRPTNVKETNTVVISTKESGLDPILVEKVHKFTKTDNPSVRSFGTDAASEKAKARMINTATDPLYYLSQKSQHTNTVQQKNKDMQDTGTDPNPIPKIDQISVGNDPLYYLSQKVTETNTLPFVTANIGTETLPTPKQISKGTDPKRLETKEDYTSYEKVRTSNKAIDTVQTKRFDKGQQHDTVVKKPKLVSVYTNTDNKITIGNFTQTSFREDIPQRTKTYNVKTQTSYESLVQKGFPILRPPRQAKILSNLADDNTPSTIQITDPPEKLASNLSVHLFIERVKEEIYRRRSQIGKSACLKSKNDKPIIFFEKNKSNSIIITNYDSNKEVNVDTFSKIIDANVMSNDKTQLVDRSDNDEFTNIIIGNNSNVKCTGKTRLSKDCGMNVHIHRSMQNIHLPSNDKYNWTYGARGREEAGDHYNVTNITDWKGIANTIKKIHTNLK